MKKEYQSFLHAIQSQLPCERIITDPLQRAAIGADASFYSMTPEVIVDVTDESHVCLVLREARKRNLPVTFRAAGTSLSGQSVTDSILVRLGRGWDHFRIYDNAQRIRLEPGLIGGNVNRRLARFDRKIGPDPASIDSAKIGGILANNASGMCCGVSQNSYQTLESIRLVLVDGTIVDTGDDLSVSSFQHTHGGLLNQLANLRETVLADTALADRIRHKFKIKNTTGYSLNALVDFEDPMDIMAHLMIGSEGTLAFISNAVLKTVDEHRHKATALVLFEHMADACRAVPILRDCPVAAAEIMDRASLSSVDDKPGMPSFLKDLDPSATALLVETRAHDPETLTRQISEVSEALTDFNTVRPVTFSTEPAECQALWNIRKGLFPAVGAVRQSGTTVIIEDVAFPLEHLADATLELQDLFKKYDYTEAIIFGHAFEGNLHFVFTQDFSHPSEVERYRRFLDDVVEMVVDRYDGSLKAEHGTGRNMAPFVEKEWGAKAVSLMRQIKDIFDPDHLLNPGVILNPDPEAHIRHLKSMPPAHEIADTCIECGFCEPVCPSKDLSFTPRQRIAGRREISRRLDAGNTRSLKPFARTYQYPGIDTCAADGLCSTRCPVGIDTGKMVKALRREAHGPLAKKMADMAADHFDAVTRTVRHTLNAVDSIHRVVGTRRMAQLTGLTSKVPMKRLPEWNREMPGGGAPVRPQPVDPANSLRVVYFPSCASRAMGGPGIEDSGHDALPAVTASVLRKAGYEIIYPKGLDRLCCGQAFESKGFLDTADQKGEELSKALCSATDNGTIPLLCDTSPCLLRIKENLDSRLSVFEPVEFVLRFLMDRLVFTPKDIRIAIHPTCSTRKMGLETRLLELARACATQVVWPQEIFCCGFAGDKGFNVPELNRSALSDLADHVCTCEAGYSTSKTCEIGLALHGGIPYRSILHLIDDVTQPKIILNKETKYEI
ncbi:MAG: FAD-binding oxidoreductase [Desulfobacteraceae bacterium]|nr:MAG: FAD-binding oxidoreductase [Desulfobacteraceae bacterium]